MQSRLSQTYCVVNHDFKLVISPVSTSHVMGLFVCITKPVSQCCYDLIDVE